MANGQVTRLKHLKSQEFPNLAGLSAGVPQPGFHVPSGIPPESNPSRLSNRVDGKVPGAKPGM
ncbi:hypothetical protein E4U46_000837 [Claviceps purpurea]|nr:hypothetical protein E4U46_000837 [Claviceps purpurea]